MELSCPLCFLLSHPFLFYWCPLPLFNRLVFWFFCCEAFLMVFSCATPVDMLVIDCCYVARSEISVTLILVDLNCKCGEIWKYFVKILFGRQCTA